MKSPIRLFLFFLLLGTAYTSLAQVGIGTTTPDPSAQLDVKSSNKGLLAPRMTADQRSKIISPADGLLVYQTDGQIGFYFRQSGAWFKLATSSEIPAVPVANPAIVSYASGNFVTLTTLGNGQTNRGSIVGISNSTSDIYLQTRGILLSGDFGANTNIDHAVIMPRNGRIKTMTSYFNFYQTNPQGVTVVATLYASQAVTGPTSSVFYPIGQGAELFMPRNGAEQDVFKFTNLDILITAGIRLLIVYSITSTGATTVRGYANASISIE